MKRKREIQTGQARPSGMA